MTARVTKMICPSCEGSGKCAALSLPGHQSIPCLWCKGEKRLIADDAARYADNLYTIAIGGYITGDHNFDDKVRMEADAERVFALLQRTPTWRSAA